MMFKVHIGYTPKGRDRWKRFATFEAAQRLCSEVFTVTGHVLTIIEEKPHA